MKLLLDENVNPAVAVRLRDGGHDVAAVPEHANLRSRSDEALFEWCQEEGRTIVTHDRDDFLALDRDTSPTATTAPASSFST